MEETRVKVTIEVNGEEKKVMEGTGAVVSVFVREEEHTRIDEVAIEVSPADMAIYMRTARDKKNGKREKPYARRYEGIASDGQPI